MLILLGGLGYGVTMFICTLIATRVGHNRNPWHGYGIGGFLFAMVVCNLMMLLYPVWYWVMNFLVHPIAAYAGTKFGIEKSLTQIVEEPGRYPGS